MIVRDVKVGERWYRIEQDGTIYRVRAKGQRRDSAPCYSSLDAALDSIRGPDGSLSSYKSETPTPSHCNETREEKQK